MYALVCIHKCMYAHFGIGHLLYRDERCIYMYTCVCVCTFFMCTYIYTCIYIHTHVYTYKHLYIEDVRSQNVHTCIYVCIHICIHTCTYFPSIIATPSPSTGHFWGKSTILTGSFAKEFILRMQKSQFRV